jgi:hypothetical protein
MRSLRALHETCRENLSDYPAHAVIRAGLRDFRSPTPGYLLAPPPIEGSILHLGTVRIPYCSIMYPHPRELIHNPPFVGGDQR